MTDNLQCGKHQYNQKKRGEKETEYMIQCDSKTMVQLI